MKLLFHNTNDYCYPIQFEFEFALEISSFWMENTAIKKQTETNIEITE